MSRIDVIKERPLHALGVLAAMLAAGAVAVGSGADFTASTANPSNTFSAGSLTTSNSKDNAAILTASNLRPGGAAQTGTVDIQNTGTLSGTFSLERGSITETDNLTAANPKLGSKLNLVITDCGLVTVAQPNPDCNTGTQVYSGTLSGFNDSASPRSLGSYNADDKHRYRFSVALDSSAGNEYQTDSSSVTFTWKATS